MKNLFNFWIPVALCLSGFAITIAGLVVLSLVYLNWLPHGAVRVGARITGIGASLILSGAVSAALHAAWTLVSNLKQ